MATNSVSGFTAGFLYPFRAGRFLLATPRLWPYVLIPFAINVVVFILVVMGGWQLFNQFVLLHIPRGEAWYWLLLSYLLLVLAVAATAILVFFTFTVIGCLIASPFNDLLAARVWEGLTGKEEEQPFRLQQFWRSALAILADEAKKIAIFVMGMLLLLLFNAVPGFGSLLYGVLSVLWTIFFLTLEYTGYIFGHLGLRFREQRHFILQRKAASLGFGAGLLCLLAIPLVQFFCIPLGVVGGTRFYHDRR